MCGESSRSSGHPPSVNSSDTFAQRHDRPTLLLQEGAKDELFRKRKAAKTGQPYEPKDNKPAGAASQDKQPNDDQAAGHSSDQKEGGAKHQPGDAIEINRAPVLTLWVSAVAQHEGFEEDSALTFGKAISGMLAQAKGRSIGIMDPQEKVTSQSTDLNQLLASYLVQHAIWSSCGTTALMFI